MARYGRRNLGRGYEGALDVRRSAGFGYLFYLHTRHVALISQHC